MSLALKKLKSKPLMKSRKGNKVMKCQQWAGQRIATTLVPFAKEDSKPTLFEDTTGSSIRCHQSHTSIGENSTLRYAGFANMRQ